MILTKLLRAMLSRPPRATTVPAEADTVAALAAQIEATARVRLGRSLAIRALDAGSCNGCELEVEALDGPDYDLESFGLHLVGSPRHADVLLVSGPVTRNMAQALRRAREAMAEPAWVVAAGDCAVDGGCFRGLAAVEGGVAAVLPVDLVILGCPPTPERLLEGLLALISAHASTPEAALPLPAGEQTLPSFTKR